MPQTTFDVCAVSTHPRTGEYLDEHFKHNKYESTLAGSWYFQTLDGYILNNNPPLAGWQTGGKYKPSNSAEGGTFDACVQSSCSI